MTTLCHDRAPTHHLDEPMTARFATILILATVLSASGCVAPHTPAAIPAAVPFQALISDRLYFGRNIPGGGVVTDAEWEAFLSDIVTPRFPAGLTVVRARGQWRDASSVIHKEDSIILDLLHPNDVESERAVQEIMTAYKTRFRQDAVLRVRDAVQVQFW
jgi:hypothetical protein